MQKPLPDIPIKNNNLRPPLKWAGGKRWLVPHLKPLWKDHEHQRLVEPTCGGLAVSLGLSPQSAFLNDLNPHVINFYQCLKNGLVIGLEMVNDEAVYYANRQKFNELIRDGKAQTEEAASYFYYLNRTGYNGLCRFNSKGEFNVPFGSYKKINYVVDFTPYKTIFKNWVFTTGYFDQVELAEEDFIYADPPYDVEFTRYSKEDFKWEDQIRLAEWLSRHKGQVILSNQATGRIIELYEKMGFQLTYLKAPRMISCTGDRTPAKEVLALKGF